MPLLRLPVSSIMTPHPATVGPKDSLAEVRRVMFANKVHHVPVVDEQGRLIGLVTTNDLRRAGPPEEHATNAEIEEALSKVVTEDIMTLDLVTIHPTDAIERAADLLGVDSFHSLPVVDGDGRLLGIVCTRDVIRFLSQRRGSMA